MTKQAHYEKLKNIKRMVTRLKEEHGDKTTQRELQIIECAIESELIMYRVELEEYECKE